MDARFVHLHATPACAAAIAERVAAAAREAGLELRVITWDEAGRPDPRADGDHPAPVVVLVGPALAGSGSTARWIRQRWPIAQMIFLGKKETLRTLEVRIAHTPLMGSYWMVTDLDSPRLPATFRDAARTAEQRNRLRTTLDRMNLQIGRRPAPDSPELRKLVVSDHMLASILTHSRDGIVSTDNRGIVTSWNRGAQMIFQLPEDKALGQPLASLAGGTWAEELPELLTAVGRGEPDPVELACRRADGTEAHVRLLLAPILDDQNRQIGISAIAHDVTELRRVLEELARSNADLEQFAYASSHDLQEPLRVVSGFASLLAERYQGKLDAQADEFIHFITDGSRRMSSLINDLLSYSRVGHQRLDFETVSLEAVLDQAQQNLQTALEETGARVTRDPLPAVRGNASQLEQLFQNLLGNAVKYRGEGTPAIHVSACRGGRRWTISVRDNGIGIDPRFSEQIFELFRRLHTRKMYPGSGIGLAVAKKIVQHHGGEIWVESVPGEGATFHFTLETAAETPTGSGEAPAAPPTWDAVQSRFR